MQKIYAKKRSLAAPFFVLSFYCFWWCRVSKGSSKNFTNICFWQFRSELDKFWDLIVCQAFSGMSDNLFRSQIWIAFHYEDFHDLARVSIRNSQSGTFQ